MVDLDSKEAIGIVLDIIETMYGNLGFLSFRLHLIKPNHDDSIYIIKYSFIPREKDTKRIFYIGKVNIQTKKMIEFKEITEEDLIEEDDS